MLKTYNRSKLAMQISEHLDIEIVTATTLAIKKLGIEDNEENRKVISCSMKSLIMVSIEDGKLALWKKEA